LFKFTEFAVSVLRDVVPEWMREGDLKESPAGSTQGPSGAEHLLIIEEVAVLNDQMLHVKRKRENARYPGAVAAHEE
jgi:hypothetical protein